jgi:hypothetical protein
VRRPAWSTPPRSSRVCHPRDSEAHPPPSTSPHSATPFSSTFRRPSTRPKATTRLAVKQQRKPGSPAAFRHSASGSNGKCGARRFSVGSPHERASPPTPAASAPRNPCFVSVGPSQRPLFCFGCAAQTVWRSLFRMGGVKRCGARLFRMGGVKRCGARFASVGPRQRRGPCFVSVGAAFSGVALVLVRMGLFWGLKVDVRDGRRAATLGNAFHPSSGSAAAPAPRCKRTRVHHAARTPPVVSRPTRMLG